MNTPIKNTKVMKITQKGSVIVWILVAVVLMASLSYAFMGSSRTSTNAIMDERSKAITYELNEYVNNVQSALKRLKLRGCDDDEISYETSVGSYPNVNAPSDESCHIFRTNGGQVVYKNLGLGVGCDLSVLNVGQACAGVVHAGVHGGNRLYTTLVNEGTAAWNNGSATWALTGVNDDNDGLTNTNTLIGLSTTDSPYEAANLCRTLGEEWYLPARNELIEMMSHQYTGSLNGTFGGDNTSYVSSSEYDLDDYDGVKVRIPWPPDDVEGARRSKENSFNVRCARRD